MLARSFAVMAAAAVPFVGVAPAGAVAYQLTGLDGFSWGNAINNMGSVVGVDTVSGRASIYRNGVYTDLGLPDGSTVHAHAINNADRVVGEVYIPQHAGELRYFLDRGFSSRDGQAEILETLPGGLFSAAIDINNHGQIVGVSQALWDPGFSYVTETVLYSDGVMRVLPGAGVSGFVPTAINDLGQIVGYRQYPQIHAVLYNPDGSSVDLGPGMARDINDRGQVIGDSGPSGGAWLYEDGRRIDLGTFDGQTTFVYAINALGQIVGEGGSRPFLYQDGGFHDLQAMIGGDGWTNLRVRGINDASTIVGSASSPDGAVHAVLLTPLPEPGSLMLMGAASIVALRPRRRRS
jgi:probable HAF family extracellular repeat protein